MWHKCARLGLLTIFVWGWSNSFRLCLLVTEDTRFGDVLIFWRREIMSKVTLTNKNSSFPKAEWNPYWGKISEAHGSWKWPEGHRGRKFKHGLWLRQTPATFLRLSKAILNCSVQSFVFLKEIWRNPKKRNNKSWKIKSSKYRQKEFGFFNTERRGLNVRGFEQERLSQGEKWPAVFHLHGRANYRKWAEITAQWWLWIRKHFLIGHWNRLQRKTVQFPLLKFAKNRLSIDLTTDRGLDVMTSWVPWFNHFASVFTRHS